MRHFGRHACCAAPYPLNQKYFPKLPYNEKYLYAHLTGGIVAGQIRRNFAKREAIRM